jgi:hypothetical protein
MFDIVSFDNVGSSMIVIFQIMVQQEWSDIMYAAWDSFSFWTWPYFLFLNIVGPMFAIQLFLVVVANRYAEAKSKQNAVDEQAASSAIFEVMCKKHSTLNRKPWLHLLGVLRHCDPKLAS